jgi:hypothetical protein
MGGEFTHWMTCEVLMRHARLIAISVTLAASLAAGPAWSDEPAATAPPKAAAKAPAASNKTDPPKTAANAPKKECRNSTGSRIPPPSGDCLAGSGHSWSQDEFDSTGKSTAGGGLRVMDPLLH